jgi:hypothetical protein
MLASQVLPRGMRDVGDVSPGGVSGRLLAVILSTGEAVRRNHTARARAVALQRKPTAETVNAGSQLRRIPSIHGGEDVKAFVFTTPPQT